MSIAFVLTSLVVCVTPGVGVMYTLSAGLTRGSRSGLLAAVGCTVGVVPHMLATITGVAAVLQASPVAFGVLKVLGVGYLLYMAWASWRDRSSLASATSTVDKKFSKVIVEAVLGNLLNPKLTVFFFAFLPQFLVPGPDHLRQLTELCAVFMLVTLVVFAAYGLFAGAVRHHVTSRPRVMTWLRRAFAVSFVALGVRLATS